MQAAQAICRRMRLLDGVYRAASLLAVGTLVAIVLVLGSVASGEPPALPPLVLAAMVLGAGGFWLIARLGQRSFAARYYQPLMADAYARFVDYAAGLPARQLMPAAGLPLDKALLAESIIHHLRADEDQAGPLLVTLTRHRDSIETATSLEAATADLPADITGLMQLAPDDAQTKIQARKLAESDEATQIKLHRAMLLQLAASDAEAEAEGLRHLLTLRDWHWRSALDRYFAIEAATKGTHTP